MTDVIAVVSRDGAGMPWGTFSVGIDAGGASVSPGAAVRTVLVLVAVPGEVADLATSVTACSCLLIPRAGEADMASHAAHGTHEWGRSGRSLGWFLALGLLAQAGSVVSLSLLSTDACPGGVNSGGGGG